MNITEEFRNDVRAYHVQSHVRVHGRNTFITESPVDDASLEGFKVYGNAYLLKAEELEPIPLDDSFFTRHASIFLKEGDVYECANKGTTVTVTGDCICSINGEPFGHVDKHELMRILMRCCGIHIGLYDDIPGAK